MAKRRGVVVSGPEGPPTDVTLTTSRGGRLRVTAGVSGTGSFEDVQELVKVIKTGRRVHAAVQKGASARRVQSEEDMAERLNAWRFLAAEVKRREPGLSEREVARRVRAKLLDRNPSLAGSEHAIRAALRRAGSRRA